MGEGTKILVQSETETHERVGVYDLASGNLRWLIDGATRCIDFVVPGRDGRQAMVLEFVQSRVAAKLIDIASGVERDFSSAGRSLLPIGELPGGDWVAEVYDSRSAHDLLREIGRASCRERV